MPLDLKKGFDGSQHVQRAARRRVADNKNRTLGESDIDILSTTYMQNNRVQSSPRLLPGTPIGSHGYRTFLKDAKFNVGVIAEQGSALEAEIRQNAKANFALLDDIQREALALDATITEDEIRRGSRFSAVHYNSWIRAQDQGVDFDDRDWLVDYKTGLTFLASNTSSIIPGAGLTLPLRYEQSIPVNDVVLVGEETDVGDTKEPIVSSSPVNVVCPNKTFRHVIIRREHDATSRLYNHTPSYCTLLLEFSSVQLANTLTIRPLGHSPVYVESLTYVNESGEEVQLGTLSYSSETMITLLFEPIRTKFLKIKFRQYAAVAKLSHEVGDIRVRELNKLLRGAGFQQLLEESSEIVQGRVFDFSIESIDVSLRAYNSLGVFRSRPVEVAGPSGASLSNQLELIQVDSSNRAYGASASLPDGTVLNEFYLGVKLADADGHLLVEDLVPMPDSFPVQTEFLPIIGGESRLKLFPDMIWTLDKYLVESAELDGSGMTIVTQQDHSLELGDYTSKLTLVPAQSETDYQVTSEDWTVTDGTTIVLNDVTGSSTLDTLSPTPFFFIDDDVSPLAVYQNGVELTIGSDYKISLDAGSTWLDDYPQDVSWIPFRDAAAAGRCRIKLVVPDYNSFYWTEYRPSKNQKLIPSGAITLRSGRVVFSRELQSSHGTIQTVAVSRADSTNIYLTPVILSYFLKVREHAS